MEDNVIQYPRDFFPPYVGIKKITEWYRLALKAICTYARWHLCHVLKSYNWSRSWRPEEAPCTVSTNSFAFSSAGSTGSQNRKVKPVCFPINQDFKRKDKVNFPNSHSITEVAHDWSHLFMTLRLHFWAEDFLKSQVSEKSGELSKLEQTEGVSPLP